MRASRISILCLSLVCTAPLPAAAQDATNPFAQKDQGPRSRKEPQPAPLAPALPAMDGVGAKPWRTDSTPTSAADTVAGVSNDGREPSGGNQAVASPASIDRTPQSPPDERSREVERSELAQPIMTGDGAGVPLDLWQGIDAKAVEELVAQLEIPPRSPALNALWRRVWTAGATPPAGQGKLSFEALKLEVLYRSGRIGDIVEILKQRPAGTDPLTAALRGRMAIGLGDREQGCAAVRQVNRAGAGLPKAIKTELLVLSAYCAAADGNAEVASLAVDLARAEAADAPLAFAALDSFTTGQPWKPQLPRRVSLIDYRFMALAKAANLTEIIERAEPALLAVIASDETLAPAARLAAGEAAARIFAIDAEALGKLYRAVATSFPDAGDPLSAKGDPAARRAQLFRALEAERTPMRRTRLARAFLDDARRAGLYMPVATIMANPVGELAPAQEIGWFAETAIEIGLAAGTLETARKWSEFAATDRPEGRAHWAALIDIADAKWPGPRGSALPAVEQMAVRGRMQSDLLHRLATVLDALDYQIPVPLWEAASKTPQPTTGHLPATGILSQLQDASKKKEFARAVLLAMRTLGPTAGDGANMIALGDTVRALKRAGLEADARRLALEAILTGWPRMVGG